MAETDAELYCHEVVASDLTSSRNSFGYSITSRAQGYAYPVGYCLGALCVAGQIGRYTGPGQIMFSGATGTFPLRISVNSMPTPSGLVMASSGEAWNFQAWHRDANPTTTPNFTNAVSVRFQ